MKILIRNPHFLGDILFSTSIADELKKEDEYSTVDFLVRWPQITNLLHNNPNIDNVFIYGNSSIDFSKYDKIFDVPFVNKIVTPPRQFQTDFGIPNPTDTFKVYISERMNRDAIEFIVQNFDVGKKTIGVQHNWKERSYNYTEYDYNNGVLLNQPESTIPRKNIKLIIDELSKNFNIIPVGLPNGIPNQHPHALDPNLLEYHCAIMQVVDCVIGRESGVINMASGAGTKCIVDMSGLWLFFGPNGRTQKMENPMLGPKWYFPNDGHVHINPFATEDDIVNIISSEL